MIKQNVPAPRVNTAGSKHDSSVPRFIVVLTALFIGATAWEAFLALTSVPAPSPSPVTAPPQSAKAPSSSSADYGPYMVDLQRRIKHCWFPPKGDVTRKVVVIMAINRDGTLGSANISQSSGSALMDESAMTAVQQAAPFRPLPAASPSHVDIEFTFDYNVFYPKDQGSSDADKSDSDADSNGSGADSFSSGSN
jgi:TonB family protein